MNKKDETARAEVTEETATKAEEREIGAEKRANKKTSKAEKENGKLVYCGPTVRGVAKQYTVFSGGMPRELEEFIQKHPEAAALVVRVEHFAQTRKRVETAGTAEAMLYRKIKSEL
mgnify:CR=1 FL=1